MTAYVTYRANTVPATPNTADTPKNASLTNTEVDANFYSLQKEVNVTLPAYADNTAINMAIALG